MKLSRQTNLATQGCTPDLEPCLGFNEALLLSRLEQRVNALLEPDLMAESARLGPRSLILLMVVVLPLTATWLHT